ncbi:MAG: F0F1 ATP synthase subunit B [Clostridiales bacterium]|nr:F0F1 ATP synthase subunit B [Clostridiales bacterium]
MNTLDIISINIWQIIISLCNLVILFLLFKKLLFKPVKNMIAERQAKVDKELDLARQAREEAENDRTLWQDRLDHAEDEAGEIIKKAVSKADRKSETIISTAKERADGIVRQAKLEAELEQKRSEEGIKKEIVDLSSILTGKMLKREINTDDHRELIDEFIDEIGEIS